MKYNDLVKSLNLAEVMFENVKEDTANIDVSFINRNSVTVLVDCKGAEVEMTITPKGVNNE